MARRPRIDFPGARHHVMNRCARREAVFSTADSRRIVINALAELPERFDVVVHGYALMPNHFHLMLGTPRGNLSQAMRHLGSEITRRINQRNRWDGSVFRGRFKNRLVHDGEDAYWMHLLAYLHLNPVPSLVALPELWDWSSHRAYVGLAPAPDWLHTEELLEAFGSVEALVRYIDDVRLGRGGAPAEWSNDRMWQSSARPRPAVAASGDVDAETAIAEVAQTTGVASDTLLSAKRGRRDNRARWVLAWWLGRRAGLSHGETGAQLGCKAGSVGNMLLRLRKSAPDAEVAGWMAELESLRR